MTTNFTDVGSFHCKFNLDHVSCDKDPWDCKSLPGPRIDDPDHELIAFRLKFMLEELKETAEALGFALQFTQDQEGFRFEFVRNVYEERAGRWKEEPTVGASETPMSEVPGSSGELDGD